MIVIASWPNFAAKIAVVVFFFFFPTKRKLEGGCFLRLSVARTRCVWPEIGALCRGWNRQNEEVWQKDIERFWGREFQWNNLLTMPLRKGNWSKQVCSKRTHLVGWGRGLSKTPAISWTLSTNFCLLYNLSWHRNIQLDKQENWGWNVIVIFYHWIEGWLCNNDIIFWYSSKNMLKLI